MINDKNLKQEGGQNSTNLQGQNVNIYNGITYRDAKEIFQDLFISNFITLKYEAAEVAQQRAEEITEKFLNKLNEKSPESLQQFQEPAMQDALFTTQKEYAKSGDTDLGDLLVDILVDRAQASTRNMVQLVLDEALKIAPSLTVEQLDTLTLIFLLIRTKSLNLRSFDDLKVMIQREIEPFVPNLSTENNLYSYLEFQRCGHIRTGSYGNLEDNWRRTYKGLFSKGMTIEELEKLLGGPCQFPSLIIHCFHNDALLQISALDDQMLEQQMEKFHVPNELKQKYRQAFESSTMNSTQIKELLLNTNKCFDKIFSVLSSSRFSNFELSFVGIAIAHANFRRRTGMTLDLSIWIK
ncbi:hypothetical protein C8N40_102116 [Pontibacter mucosus]|uniref:Uncharacterized protein n=1 Tax=Pontibacter mucosus TaxID=1649266 RepID=A0A2T5YP98_9BACT|nr:LPO_1073/Vpar_1526 family protein [Pontibacter mucosus]PTX21147.1 hypothetical protein C8N40_102116 [Pontibacter mucosus]